MFVFWYGPVRVRAPVKESWSAATINLKHHRGPRCSRCVFDVSSKWPQMVCDELNHSMSAFDAEALSDENVHVKELKRLFNASNVDRNGALSREGIVILCEKLHLRDFSTFIAERVLCNEETVNFKQFKDRFLSFLPDIIDLASGNADQLIILAHKTSTALGFQETRKLSVYDMRLVCENTPELDLLSAVDINLLFEKVARGGKASVSEFVAQYRKQKRVPDEVHFTADSYRISTSNLFESLDVQKTGNVDRNVLVECLTSSGLKIEDILDLLQELGQPNSPSISLIILCNYVEACLAQVLNNCSVAARAAILCMRLFTENLRCSLKESELRCEHMQKQLQVANQRRTLLIEELDQNQQSIEMSYNSRLREMEERCRARITNMEEKHRAERSELQREIEVIEEDLTLVRHNETFLKNKLALLERHNKRISDELAEQTESVNQLEQANRQLRTDLNKKQQFRISEENAKMWKQKAEMLVAHNKLLREKLQEVKKVQKTESYNDSFVLWTPSFRSQLMLIRKRRLQKGDTLSEMDTEPESIFYRRRQKRLVKRKDRKRRYEKIHQVQSVAPDPARSSNFSSPTNSRVNVRVFASGAPSIKSEASLRSQQENSLNDRLLIEKHSGTADFKATSSFSKSASDVGSLLKKYENDIKTLQSTILSQKQNYEDQLNGFQRHPTVVDALRSDSSEKIYALGEKYRRVPEIGVESVPYLNVEKRLTGAYHKLRHIFTPIVNGQQCTRCAIAELKICELVQVFGNGFSKDSSVEDPTPSKDTNDKTALQNEVTKLKSRLATAKEKFSELRMVLSMPSSNSRYTFSFPNGNKVNGSSMQRFSPRSFADLSSEATPEKLTRSSKERISDPSHDFTVKASFEAVMLSLLSLIIASGTVLRADTELWEPSTYPDPRTNSTECNAPYEGTLCDPDHILTDTWRQTILDNVAQHMKNLMNANIHYTAEASDECHSNTTEGVQLFVILAKRIHTSSNQSITSNDLTLFGHGLRDAFGLDSMPCKNYVLVLGVEHAKQIYVWTGSDLAVPKEQFDSSLEQYKNLFTERNYMEGLNKIVDEIVALLLDPFKENTTTELNLETTEASESSTTETTTGTNAPSSAIPLWIYVTITVCLCLMTAALISIHLPFKNRQDPETCSVDPEKSSNDSHRIIDNFVENEDNVFVFFYLDLCDGRLLTDRVVARRNSETYVASHSQDDQFSSL
ncbi:unnamed protein product [Caenorhabditis auriculariae]|uniref:EF-hand domain-containing protein n=1 Tax=Caenorhabditis auriculariae TaxID=2777116 RepID=A0A8S1H2L5_9PELO|nr:unnamed protein product [Caenorhabditis auriculariae]